MLFNTTLTWRPVGQPPERRSVAAELEQVLDETFSLTLPPAELQAAARVAAAARPPNPGFS